MSKDASLIKSRLQETERIAKDTNFSDLEKVLNRELSFFEKRDAIYRFNEFVSTMREEYGRMIGAEVFITRGSENLKKKSET